MVDHVIAVGLAYVGQRYDLGAAARGRRERVADLLGRPRQLDGLHFFDLLQTALHLGGLRCFGAETVHKAHLPLYLSLLPGGGRLPDLKGALAGNQIIVIVAPEMHHLVRLKGKNPGCDLVQKSAVVRCDDHAALKRGQVLLEPPVCIEVKVVGWLVEEQEVGLPEQRPGKACPHGPATAELADGPEKVALLEAKA